MCSTVALLVRRGGCSLAEKALVASTMIEPPNTVQYLIVEDYGRRRRRGPLTENSYDENGRRNLVENFSEEESLEERDNDELIFDGMKVLDLGGTWDGTSNIVGVDNSMQQTRAELYDDAEPSSITTSSIVGIAGDKFSNMNAKDEGIGIDEEAINVAVLHVTYSVGYDLLGIINKESAQTRHSGGTKIFLNSKEPSIHARTIVLWMLSTLIMCACCCCCMLMFVQTNTEPEQQQAPQRPVRRRLTLDQVRNNFPAFHFDPVIHHQEPKPQDSSDDDNESESPSQKTYCQLLDECTICLDEFSPGDRCRQLPCGHIFHSTCIARWLIERSAVCPLCKLDLYEEEEEEDESNSDNETESPSSPSAALLSWWGNLTLQHPSLSSETAALVQPGASNGGSTQQQAEIPSGAADDASTERDPNAPTTAETRSWWPFSLEIGDGITEEHSNDNYHGESASPSTTRRLRRGFGWGLNWFGRQRRFLHQIQQHQTTEAADGGLVTELTEPLISDITAESLLPPSSENERRQLEEVTFTSEPGSLMNSTVESDQQPQPPPSSSTAVEI
jgi:Ring finger domain